MLDARTPRLVALTFAITLMACSTSQRDAAPDDDEAGAAGGGGSGATGMGGTGVIENTNGGTSSSGGTTAAGGSAGDPGVAAGSLEELLAAAPLEAPVAGTLTNWEYEVGQQLTFSVPVNWTATQYADGIQMVSPGEAAEQCAIFILLPRPAAADEEGLYQQLLDALLPLFPEIIVDAAMDTRLRGVSGVGFEWVGLDLYVGPSARGEPYLAVFGDLAVPVVPFGESSGSCWTGSGGSERADVFHSLTLPAHPLPAPGALASAVSGVWFTGSGSYGNLIVLGEGGDYGHSVGMSLSVPAGSYVVEETTTVWTADEGAYAVNWNILSFVPTSAGDEPYSQLFRVYEWAVEGGEWRRYLCLHSSVTTSDGAVSPNEPCFTREAD